MLDLTARVGTYEIKMLDGRVLHLLRPTQGFMNKLVSLKDLDASKMDAAEMLGTVTGIFLTLVNRNTEGVSYDQKQVEEDYDVILMMYVVQDYFRHWNDEIAAKVDFQPAR